MFGILVVFYTELSYGAHIAKVCEICFANIHHFRRIGQYFEFSSSVLLANFLSHRVWITIIHFCMVFLLDWLIVYN